MILFVNLSRWVAGFVFYCVKNRNPPPTLQPGIFLCAYVIGWPMSWAALSNQIRPSVGSNYVGTHRLDLAQKSIVLVHIKFGV